MTFPNKGYEGFPLGKHLCVVAEVTEKASGIKFFKMDNSAVFTDNPIKLDCDLMSSFYRPNVPLQMQVSKSKFYLDMYGLVLILTTDRHTDNIISVLTDKQTERQADRQANRQRNGRIDGQTDSTDRQIHKRADMVIDVQFFIK